MKIFLSLIILSCSAFAKDSVPIGANGKVTVLFEKDGYLMARHCPDYTIVNSRKDCKAKADLQIMPISRLKSFLLTEARVAINEGLTKDKRFEIYKNKETYSFLLDDSVKKEALSRRDQMKTYREKFGPGSIDEGKLAYLENLLKLDSEALEYGRIVNAEVDRTVERILDGKTLNHEGLATSDLSLELTQRLIDSIRLGKQYTGDGKSCRLTKRKDEWFEVVGSDEDIKNYYGICIPGNSSVDCFSEISKMVKESKCQQLQTTSFTEVPIDPTADEAISQTQRSIILKDTPASIQGGQGTQAKGTGKQ